MHAAPAWRNPLSRIDKDLDGAKTKMSTGARKGYLPRYLQLSLQFGLVAGPSNKSRSAEGFWACCGLSRLLSNAGSVLERADLLGSKCGDTRGESGRAFM